jgi:hypothetical protein
MIFQHFEDYKNTANFTVNGFGPCVKKCAKIANILAKVESYPSSPWSPGFSLLRFAAGSGPEQKIEILLLFI